MLALPLTSVKKTGTRLFLTGLSGSSSMSPSCTRMVPSAIMPSSCSPAIVVPIQPCFSCSKKTLGCSKVTSNSSLRLHSDRHRSNLTSTAFISALSRSVAVAGTLEAPNRMPLRLTPSSSPTFTGRFNVSLKFLATSGESSSCRNLQPHQAAPPNPAASPMPTGKAMRRKRRNRAGEGGGVGVFSEFGELVISWSLEDGFAKNIPSTLLVLVSQSSLI